MERDNVHLKIDIIGALTKLMYLVADNTKVDAIMTKYIKEN